MNPPHAAPPEYLRCGEFDSAEPVKFHEHPGTELILITAGACEIEVDGLRLAGEVGSLFVIPAGAQHNQLNPRRTATRYVIFRKNGDFDDRTRVLHLAADPWIARWLDELFILQRESHPRLHEFGSGLVRLILCRLAELEHDDRTQDAYPPALRRALNFLDCNYTAPIDLDELAAAAGLSAEYLCALFRRHLGRSPVACLLELRLDYARRLLGDPYLSIKEVSRRSGFNDPNYFARRFRRRFGVTPAAHRHGEERAG